MQKATGQGREKKSRFKTCQLQHPCRDCPETRPRKQPPLSAEQQCAATDSRVPRDTEAAPFGTKRGNGSNQAVNWSTVIIVKCKWEDIGAPGSRSWCGRRVSLHKDRVTWAGAPEGVFINGKTRVPLEATPLFLQVCSTFCGTRSRCRSS